MQRSDAQGRARRTPQRPGHERRRRHLHRRAGRDKGRRRQCERNDGRIAAGDDVRLARRARAGGPMLGPLAAACRKTATPGSAAPTAPAGPAQRRPLRRPQHADRGPGDRGLPRENAAVDRQRQDRRRPGPGVGRAAACGCGSRTGRQHHPGRGPAPQDLQPLGDHAPSLGSRGRSAAPRKASARRRSGSAPPPAAEIAQLLRDGIDRHMRAVLDATAIDRPSIQRSSWRAAEWLPLIASQGAACPPAMRVPAQAPCEPVRARAGPCREIVLLHPQRQAGERRPPPEK